MSTQALVAKLWNLCNLLRDDGVTSFRKLKKLVIGKEFMALLRGIKMNLHHFMMIG